MPHLVFGREIALAIRTRIHSANHGRIARSGDDPLSIWRNRGTKDQICTQRSTDGDPWRRSSAARVAYANSRRSRRRHAMGHSLTCYSRTTYNRRLAFRRRRTAWVSS